MGSSSPNPLERAYMAGKQVKTNNGQTRQCPCVVILTALPVERQTVYAHLANIREEIHPRGTVYQYGYFSNGPRAWEIA
jgi:hypothetical protein